MEALSPIFSRHALAGIANDAGAVGQDQAGSDSAQDAAMTLEYRYNPFQHLMKQIEVLLETDPREALRQLKLVQTDKHFTKPHELAKIDAKLDQALALTHENRPLGAAFTRSALHVPVAAPPAAGPIPVLYAHMTPMAHGPVPAPLNF